MVQTVVCNASDAEDENNFNLEEELQVNSQLDQIQSNDDHLSTHSSVVEVQLTTETIASEVDANTIEQIKKVDCVDDMVTDDNDALIKYDIAPRVEDSMNTIEAAGVISVIDCGCFMKVKYGVAGETAEQDSFPLLNITHQRWINFLWNDDRAYEWSLVQFTSEPVDPYREATAANGGNQEGGTNRNSMRLNFSNTNSVAHHIYLRDITDLYLELEPSCSFRIYIGQEVLKLTPMPVARGHVAAWVDALFAGMQLQTHQPETEVMELRSRYMSMLEDQIKEENEKAQIDANNFALVTVNDGNISSFGGGEEESIETNKKRASHRVSYEDIYNQNITENHSNISCCILS